MAVVLPLSAGELRVLESLVRHRIRFMVVGLSAAALQGAPVVTQDVDLWFEAPGSDRMIRAIREAGATYVPPFGINPPMLVGDDVQQLDIVLHMHGLGKFDKEFARAQRIKVGRLSLPVLELSRIVVSKESLQRPKDQAVLPVLRSSIQALSTEKGQPARRVQKSVIGSQRRVRKPAR